MDKFTIGEIVEDNHGVKAFMVKENLAEIISPASAGWSRDKDVPESYRSKYTNRYWFVYSSEGWKSSDYKPSKKVKKEVTPKFLLQYEIEEDPFEEFHTIAEVKKRIKELVKKGGHNFVLWEIKKKTVLDVSKIESVVIKGI